MALRIRNIRNGTEFEGFNLEYILDEDVEVGEVYLDENLIYQSDDIFTETQLKQDFKNHFRIADIADDLVGIDFDSIDYNIEGVATGLYTPGGEYMTTKGTEFIGDYHVHPDGIAMQGKFHDAELSEEGRLASILELMDDEDIIAAKERGSSEVIDYTVDADIYPWLGIERDPIELTDDELLEEQRKEADVERFRIEEDESDLPGRSAGRRSAGRISGGDRTRDPDAPKQKGGFGTGGIDRY